MFQWIRHNWDLLLTPILGPGAWFFALGRRILAGSEATRAGEIYAGPSNIKAMHEQAAISSMPSSAGNQIVHQPPVHERAVPQQSTFKGTINIKHQSKTLLNGKELYSSMEDDIQEAIEESLRGPLEIETMTHGA